MEEIVVEVVVGVVVDVGEVAAVSEAVVVSGAVSTITTAGAGDSLFRTRSRKDPQLSFSRPPSFARSPRRFA